MSEASQLRSGANQHTLYTALRADGTPTRAVPEPRPSKHAELTKFPATVDALCVPWLSESIGDIISFSP